ncbi:MAG: tryptophan synthase subunit alpha [bacterium]
MTVIRPIREKFNELKQKNEIALILYMTAGFPSLSESMNNLVEFAKNGADIIEIGIPFSDPVADGPTIQYSSQIALSHGVTLKDIISEIDKTKIDIPLVIMSYLNPVLAYGKERLLKDMKDAGISGIIIPDLPVEESEDWPSLSEAYNIDVIFLAAPTSSGERIRLIAQHSRGFIYYVSITGTTGVRNKLSSGLSGFIKNMRQATDKPIAVGFGISSPEQIVSLREEVDGVIIGSRIIEAMRKKEDLKIVVRNLKEATRR